jgi:hypothetical protein
VYWRSLGGLSSRDLVYSTTFENFGPGYIIVRFVRSSTMAEPVIHRVSFCLPVSATSAGLVVQTLKKLLQSKNIELPPNVDELLRDSLKPVETST